MSNTEEVSGKDLLLKLLSKEELSDTPWDQRKDPIQADPLFITASMIDVLREQVADVVVCNPSDIALSQGTKGMYYSPMQAKAAGEMLGVGCHKEASAKLVPVLKRVISS